MRHARLFLAIALIAAGCALLVASYEPRPVGQGGALVLGQVRHVSTVLFLSRGETATDANT